MDYFILFPFQWYLIGGSISEGTDEGLEPLDLSVFDLNDPHQLGLVLT